MILYASMYINITKNSLAFIFLEFIYIAFDVFLLLFYRDLITFF